MNDTSRIDIVTVDLAKPLQREKYGTLLATGDVNANRFGATIVRNGEAVDVTGYEVTGSFIRPDGATVTLDGTAEGSVVYVDLSSACYISDGAFSLAVKIIKEGYVQTVRMIDGYIRRTASDSFVAEDETVIDIEQIKEYAEEVAATTEKANNVIADAMDAAADARNATQGISSVTAPPIIPTATGDVVAVSDSAARPLQGLTLYGATTQDGTPTPDAPVPLVSAGDGGSIGVKMTGLNILHLHDHTRTNNGVTSTVANEKITSSGTVTNTYANLTYFVPFVIRSGEVYTVAIDTAQSVDITFRFATDTTDTVFQQVIIRAGQTYKTFTANADYAQARLFAAVAAAGAVVSISDMGAQVAIGSTATAFEPYADGGSVTASTPNGLPGIPVSSGGNYTDEKGQQWICDEIDFGRGVYVQRVAKVVFNSENAYFTTTGTWCGRIVDHPAEKTLSRYLVLSSHYKTVGSNVSRHGNVWVHYSGDIMFHNNAYTDAATMEEDLAQNPVDVVYALATPTETALSAEELAAYAAMQTQYPNTTVYNDAGAGMAVAYVADTKNYIDQRIAALLNA